MAIIREVTLNQIRFTKATLKPMKEPDTLWVEYTIMVDDTEDDQPPVYRANVYRLYADSDISNEEDLVKRLHAAAFAK